MSRSPNELGVVTRPGGFIRRPAKKIDLSALPDLPARFKDDPPREAPAVPAAVSPTPGTALSTRIFVRGLIVEAEVGVYAHEKGIRRPLIVDIDVWTDPSPTPLSDHLADTIDYDTLVAHARTVVADAHIHLIETIAEQIAAACLSDSRVLRARVKIEKPGAVPGAACSGVEVERGRT